MGSKQGCHIFLVDTKEYNEHFIAEICGNIAEICGQIFEPLVKPTFPARVAMAKKNQEPASLFCVSREPLPWIHGSQTSQRTRLWVPQFGKIMYRIFLFYRIFCFPSRFFKPRWSITFFSCTWVSQLCLFCFFVFWWIDATDGVFLVWFWGDQ